MLELGSWVGCQGGGGGGRPGLGVTPLRARPSGGRVRAHNAAGRRGVGVGVGRRLRVVVDIVARAARAGTLEAVNKSAQRVFFVGRLATRARLVQRLSRAALGRRFAGSSPCEGLRESVFGGRGQGTARHGTARHGTARHGTVGWGRAGGRERFGNEQHGLDRLGHRLVLLRHLLCRLLLQHLWPVAWARSEQGSKGCARAGSCAWDRAPQAC